MAEGAHVLRTQYGIDQRDILDSLIGLVQRQNVRGSDARADVLVAMGCERAACPAGRSRTR